MSAERLEVRGFGELSADDVYDVLALRAQVFVVEQRCAYLDPDGADRGARHVLARVGGELVGTARILGPPWRIGRVVVDPGHRGSGLGRRLVTAALDVLPGDAPVRLSAQAHLTGFYAALGFRSDGPPHDEDGIPHVEMVRPPLTGSPPPGSRPRSGRR